jgi:oligopeptide transport system permease protein
MAQFAIRRILWMVPTLFFVSLITFVIMHSTPGGPFDNQAESRTNDPRVIERLEKQFGLGKPLFFDLEGAQKALSAGQGPVAAVGAFFNGQYFAYVRNLFQGKLGPSFTYKGRQVEDVLLEARPGQPFYQSRVGTTFFLGLLAMTLAMVIGFPLGLIAGLNHNKVIDNVSLFFATIGYGIPSLIMGLLLIMIFAVWLGWIRVMNFDYWKNWNAWILPALALALPTSAYVARLTRASVVEVMRQDYIRTARAKGLQERSVIIRHIVRNSLIPVVTFIGPALAGLVTGSFVIESQFNVNGIGFLFVTAIGKRDYTIIMALTLFYALLVAIANMSVDIVYGFLDPRIRASGKG